MIGVNEISGYTFHELVRLDPPPCAVADTMGGQHSFKPYRRFTS